MRRLVAVWAFVMLLPAGMARADEVPPPELDGAAGRHLPARSGPCEPDLPREPPRLLALHRALHALRCGARARSGRSGFGQRQRDDRSALARDRQPRPELRLQRAAPGQGLARRGRVPADHLPLDRDRARPGRSSANIAGELALHGITQPVTLEATFNGGYGSHPLDPGGSRIGFSAHGTLLRSAFGIDDGLPSPGSDFGVGDQVELVIEAEFLRPKDAPQ